MNDARNEILIQTPEEGALAVAACIIVQAVEDVRMFLKTPNLTANCRTKASLFTAGAEEKRRRGRAAEAARWLDGDDCRMLCEILANCGYQVPMLRMKRKLAGLKRKGAVCG